MKTEHQASTLLTPLSSLLSPLFFFFWVWGKGGKLGDVLPDILFLPSPVQNYVV
jgi:hypothetical protein